MTVTEPTDSPTGPAVRHTLRHIYNHAPALPCCSCGHCLADDDYSDNELALDACVTHMLDMLGVIESRTSRAHATIMLSLRVLHELVDDARKLLCVQRQTARALASLRTQ